VYCLEFAGEDDRFAACEARSVATDVSRIGVGLATARGIDPGGIERLAYTRRASDLLGHTDASIASAVALLSAATVDRTGTVAVRARDVRSRVGVDTQRVERELGQVLVDRGFEIDLDDPDHELRAVFAPSVPDEEDVDSGDVGDEATVDGDDVGHRIGEDDDGGAICVLGWLTAESIRDYGERKPTDRPFFQPGSMDPLLARALVNVAGAREGATILDPMCGTGGVLIEAGLVGARVVGVDAQTKMVRGARENLAAALPADVDSETIRGDAARLPISDGTVDGVVFDAPYGRQSKIEADRLETLVAGALAEARRVGSRAVVVADRPWVAEAREAGWTVVERFERRVHRSLVRHVLVLEDSDRVP
jgi:tRNA (guanine10-N2)-dimethyltransferase